MIKVFSLTILFIAVFFPAHTPCTEKSNFGDELSELGQQQLKASYEDEVSNIQKNQIFQKSDSLISEKINTPEQEESEIANGLQHHSDSPLTHERGFFQDATENNLEEITAENALKIIPTRKPLQRYEQLWKRSPFVIATPTTNSPVQQNTQYTLASIIKVGEEYFAHVIETATQRRLPVSKKPSPEHSLILVDVREDPVPQKTTATIKVRGTTLTVGFDTNLHAQPSFGNMAGIQNINTYASNPQSFAAIQNQNVQNQQQIIQQQILQQQLIQQQLMQQQQQHQPVFPGGVSAVAPSGAGSITPPEVTTTRRIIRRPISHSANTNIDMPPNTIVNPPTQQ